MPSAIKPLPPLPVGASAQPLPLVLSAHTEDSSQTIHLAVGSDSFLSPNSHFAQPPCPIVPNRLPTPTMTPLVASTVVNRSSKLTDVSCSSTSNMMIMRMMPASNSAATFVVNAPTATSSNATGLVGLPLMPLMIPTVGNMLSASSHLSPTISVPIDGMQQHSGSKWLPWVSQPGAVNNCSGGVVTAVPSRQHLSCSILPRQMVPPLTHIPFSESQHHSQPHHNHSRQHQQIGRLQEYPFPIPSGAFVSPPPNQVFQTALHQQMFPSPHTQLILNTPSNLAYLNQQHQQSHHQLPIHPSLSHQQYQQQSIDCMISINAANSKGPDSPIHGLNLTASKRTDHPNKNVDEYEEEGELEYEEEAEDDDEEEEDVEEEDEEEERDNEETGIQNQRRTNVQNRLTGKTGATAYPSSDRALIQSHAYSRRHNQYHVQPNLLSSHDTSITSTTSNPQ
ncbi:unnamed protein product, partial [Protopolystoma xenopodis]